MVMAASFLLPGCNSGQQASGKPSEVKANTADAFWAGWSSIQQRAGQIWQGSNVDAGGWGSQLIAWVDQGGMWVGQQLRPVTKTLLTWKKQVEDSIAPPASKSVKLPPVIGNPPEKTTLHRFRDGVVFTDLDTVADADLISLLKAAQRRGWVYFWQGKQTFSPNAPLTAFDWGMWRRFWPGVQRVPFPESRLQACQITLNVMQKHGSPLPLPPVSHDEELDYLADARPVGSADGADAITDLSTLPTDTTRVQAAQCYQIGLFQDMLGDAEGSPTALVSNGLKPYKPLTREQGFRLLYWLSHTTR